MKRSREYRVILSLLLTISMMIGAFGLAGCADVEKSREEETSDTEITSSGAPSAIVPDDNFQPVAGDTVTLETADVRVDISVKNGVEIKSVFDKVIGHDYLKNGVSLFKYTVFTDLDSLSLSAWRSEGTVLSKKSLDVTGAMINENGNALRLDAVSGKKDLAFHIEIAFTDSMSLDINLSVTSSRDEKIFMRVSVPTLTMLNIGHTDAKIMIPQEAGWITQYGEGSHLGYTWLDGISGMPTMMNAMEIVSVHSEELGGGIFFSDINGYVGGENSLIQFISDGYEIEGLWGVGIGSGETRNAPALTVGLFRNSDWRYSVDYYVSHRTVSPGEDPIPEWWLESGGVFSTQAGSGGPFTFWYGSGGITSFAEDFSQLDAVLKEAESYGIDTIYLTDWYECPDRNDTSIPKDWWTDPSLDPYYWNKGEYVPRADLGGEDSFRTGIGKVHENGGRVILYVEPFIVLYYSSLAKNQAKDWYAIDGHGQKPETYEYNYDMVPANPEWQEYLADVCARLVGEYGADGIYLDSAGWQYNHVVAVAGNRDKVYDPEEYNIGWVDLLKRVRKAVREVNSEGIVLCESGCGPMLYAVDGGWTSDFVWGMTTTAKELSLSPLRYAMSSLGIATNGDTISSLNQVFAAGYSLAVFSTGKVKPWKAYASYIGKLVSIRRTYADALVYGRAVTYPETDNDLVAACCFAGEENTVITAVNLAKDKRQKAVLSLGTGFSDVIFTNAVDGATYAADAAGNLEIAVRTDKVMVLVKGTAG